VISLKVWSSRSRGCCVEKAYTFYEGICFGIDIGNEIAIEVKEKIQERIRYSNLSRELSQLIVTLFRFIYIKLGVVKGSNDSNIFKTVWKCSLVGGMSWGGVSVGSWNDIGGRETYGPNVLEKNFSNHVPRHQLEGACWTYQCN
jgi:hypothetical protein